MSNREANTDVILIGAGIMSATLGSLLKELVPDWNVKVFERLGSAGEESSNVWNNAGTGHAALCELNYTQEHPDGSIDITKAIKVNEQFQVSKQFWSYLVNSHMIRNPQEFILSLPHMSFVQGEKNVSFLRKRFETMSNNPLFEGMEFTDDTEKLKEWIPLMMENRTVSEPIAATKIDSGTDVNFGDLTRKLFDHLERSNGLEVNYKRSVEDITRTSDGLWEVKIHDYENEKIEYHTANFVFIGGGGGSLHLLQKTGIPESKKIGGFPVSGQFMVCNNSEVAEQHYAKVYGKAKVGAPPMSVPHLDTRLIDNKTSLLFGPFAGFSPKFLKTGSLSDLLTSVKKDNLVTMVAAGVKNVSLTKYLIEQVIQSKEQRMEELREFIPNAKSEDWDLVTAGQRVQVIKDTKAGKGTLQFGTEVVSSSDGSIAALLGASPGASTAVSVMLEVLERCFPHHIKEWEPKIKEMIPSYGESLSENPELIREVHKTTDRTLKLETEKLAESI
ncbi:malate:quinone oxidoreductase [Halobacillus sp. A5]|uniref:malate:quinone oxidoreductase n=1 Tax=Halobacillus sp. A5 TaxID=2880263 RepID=UPI0020A6AB99|nr:malate:quinone oxidoreductase [Halobacillus sp. A5]MCP3027041.1 malate:quinone oxidoreductase [Halobacillus sp. A5]